MLIDTDSVFISFIVLFKIIIPILSFIIINCSFNKINCATAFGLNSTVCGSTVIPAGGSTVIPAGGSSVILINS